MSLSDRVVLVTGATGALGPVVVQTFAEAGARLGLVGRDGGRLADVAAKAGLTDNRWAPGVGDLTDREQAATAIDRVVAKLGRIDVLLHLVGGYGAGGRIESFTDDDLRSMLNQHVWSTLHVARAVLPGMVERGWGRVVAVSASVVTTTPPGLGAYAVAKAGEEALLRTISREVADRGVTVNVLVVRKIDTEHERDTAPSPKNAKWTTPEEVATRMLELCADEASATTGQRITMDGQT